MDLELNPIAPPTDLTCPSCGGHLSRIVYGIAPPRDPDAVWAGCVVRSATHACRECGNEFAWDGRRFVPDAG